MARAFIWQSWLARWFATGGSRLFSFRSLTLTYAAALLIIAGLTVCSHFVLRTTLRDTEGTAAMINATGRQRMLSQRIASLAAQRQLGDSGVAEALTSAIDLFESANARLVAPYREPGREEGAQALHMLYFEGASPLDGMVRDYTTAARQMLALPEGDPAAAPLLKHLFSQSRKALLDALNEATAIEQRRGETRVLHLEWLQSAILTVVLATLLLEALVIFRPMITRIMRQLTEILTLATTDSLTGVTSRRSFLEQCETEWLRVVRGGGAGSGVPLSVLALDIDHFKRVNDTLGHAAGDAVLRTIGEMLRQELRASDRVGRLGGEEFAMLLPGSGRAEAASAAERLRQRVATRTVAGAETVAVTVSIGVATLAGRDEPMEALLRRADAAMYGAKRAGRNRVMVD